jgi:hypothetical protein
MAGLTIGGAVAEGLKAMKAMGEYWAGKLTFSIPQVGLSSTSRVVQGDKSVLKLVYPSNPSSKIPERCCLSKTTGNLEVSEITSLFLRVNMFVWAKDLAPTIDSRINRNCTFFIIGFNHSNIGIKF